MSEKKNILDQQKNKEDQENCTFKPKLNTRYKSPTSNQKTSSSDTEKVENRLRKWNDHI